MDMPELTYSADGLVPCIVQDADTLEVLMMAWMNEESLELTLERGETVFWSRSRQELWHKGATSGNVQKLVELRYDCDADTLLALVHPAGPACHTGERTGCDMLAVAIGTAHGKYPADYVPTLDFDRLAEIKKALGEKYPLVLHGGSGAGDENFKKAVAGGINKVNLWTDYGRTYVNAMRDFLAENESPDYIFVTTDAEEKAAKWLERYMDLFGSSNRYQFSDDKMVETD